MSEALVYEAVRDPRGRVSKTGGTLADLVVAGRIASWARTAVRSPGLDGTVEAARLANSLEVLRQRGGRYGLLVIPAALGEAMAMVAEGLA